MHELKEIERKLDHLLEHVHLMQMQMNLIINLVRNDDRDAIVALTNKLRVSQEALSKSITNS